MADAGVALIAVGMFGLGFFIAVMLCGKQLEKAHQLLREKQNARKDA